MIELLARARLIKEREAKESAGRIANEISMQTDQPNITASAKAADSPTDPLNVAAATEVDKPKIIRQPSIHEFVGTNNETSRWQIVKKR